MSIKKFFRISFHLLSWSLLTRIRCFMLIIRCLQLNRIRLIKNWIFRTSDIFVRAFYMVPLLVTNTFSLIVVLNLPKEMSWSKAHCLRFREFHAVTMQLIMSDLPKERIAYQSPPFTNTGLDYFGPFYVTVRRSTEKSWGFLFTCLTTRAVHIEIVTSIDTRS